jgi:hypothetical protein
MKVRPIIEEMARRSHEDWMQDKRDEGVESWPSPWGEELMVSWDELSERAKNQNRRSVRRFFKTLAELT